MAATPIRNRYLLARPGRMFIVAILCILLAAYGLSLSVLYIFAALFIATMIYNLLITVATLRSIQLNAPALPTLFARKPGSLDVDLKNRSRLWRANHLRFSVMDAAWSSKTQVVDMLDKDTVVSRPVEIVPPDRGWHELKTVGVETSFPFGLVTHGKQFSLNKRLLIYPALLAMPHERHLAVEQIQSRVPKSSDDFQYLDAYQEGDDVRLIHWRKSTLSTKPVIRRDLSATRDTIPRLFVPDPCPYFEYALSAMATYFWQENPKETWAVFASSGLIQANDAAAMLAILATLTPLPSKPTMDSLETLPYKPLLASALKPSIE